MSDSQMQLISFSTWEQGGRMTRTGGWTTDFLFFLFFFHWPNWMRYNHKPIKLEISISPLILLMLSAFVFWSKISKKNNDNFFLRKT